MTASRTTLPFQTAAEVDLTVLFNGEPLAIGTEVALTGPDGAWSGLPTKAAASTSGRINLPALTALNSGTLVINGEVAGYSAGLVQFTVDVIDTLTLEASPLTLKDGEKTSLKLTVRKNGTPLPVGETVEIISDPGLIAVPSSAVTAVGGEIIATQAQAQSLGPLSIQVRYGTLLSNLVTIQVKTAGQLTLTVQPMDLEFLVPTDLNLTVQLNGQNLPSGTMVTIAADSGLAGLTGSGTVGAGGVLTIPQAVAQKSGPLKIQVKSQNLTSNEVSLGVFALEGQFSLNASPNNLEFMVPTDTVFTLLYRNLPVPAGLAVTLVSPDQKLAPLPSTTTKTGGLIAAPSVRALSPAGPLIARAKLSGFSQEPSTNLSVFVLAAQIAGQIQVSPDIKGLNPDYALLNGPLIDSCRSFQMTMTVTYRGEIAANTPVKVKGFNYSQSGQQVTTSGSGQVSGTIYYSLTDKPAYAAEPKYEITIGSATAQITGPKPVNFLSCS
jgi:hypothetical protein